MTSNSGSTIFLSCQEIDIASVCDLSHAAWISFSGRAGGEGEVIATKDGKANSALMINRIVDGLVPTLGAYSLAIYSILEGQLPAVAL